MITLGFMLGVGGGFLAGIGLGWWCHRHDLEQLRRDSEFWEKRTDFWRGHYWYAMRRLTDLRSPSTTQRSFTK